MSKYDPIRNVGRLNLARIVDAIQPGWEQADYSAGYQRKEIRFLPDDRTRLIGKYRGLYERVSACLTLMDQSGDPIREFSPESLDVVDSDFDSHFTQLVGEVMRLFFSRVRRYCQPDSALSLDVEVIYENRNPFPRLTQLEHVLVQSHYRDAQRVAREVSAVRVELDRIYRMYQDNAQGR